MSGKMAVALALVGVLALTGVAFATGAIDRLFSWMQEWGEHQAADLEKLDELADSGFGEEKEDTEFVGSISTELNQAYYDGYQLIVGAKYSIGTNQVMLGLEHELMALTRPEDPSFCAVRYSEGDMPVMINESGWIEERSSLIPANIAMHMTDEQIAAFEKAYEVNGEAGAVVYTAYESDHIGIEGDVGDDACPEDDQRKTDAEGNVWRYVDFGELPEGCVNKDSLTVTFGIHQTANVVRVDQDGVWVASHRLEKTEFPFVVENNGQNMRFAYGSFENETYSAKVELRVSDVSTRLKIDMTYPAEWKKADSEAMSTGDGEVDYIWDYRVLMPDGSWEHVVNRKTWTETGCQMKGYIELQEGQTEVILRPCYMLSGLHEGEDIVISLENGISSVK